MEIYRIAASTDNVGSLPPFTKIHSAYLLGGSANSSASIFDDVTQTGIAKFILNALSGTQSPQIELEGFSFKKGVSVTLTGTGAILYLMVE